MKLRGERGALLDSQKEALTAEPDVRFAYLVLPVGKLGDAQYNLNNMGVQGWELTAVDMGLAFMKRAYTD